MNGNLKNKQQLRRRRAIAASFNYPLLISLVLAFDYIGYSALSTNQLIFMLVSATLISAVLAWFFITEKNLEYDDPSMTGFQMVVCSLWGVGPLIFMPEIRPLLLMLYFPAFTFGILRFDRVQYFKLFIFIFCLYSIILIAEVFWLRPELLLAYELLLYIFFFIVLAWFSYFGALISELRRNLKRQNITDELTQQYNRRHALSTLKYIHHFCERYNETYALVIIDLDYFKQVNDQYGHFVGDEVLVDFATAINQTLRSVDILVLPPETKFGDKAKKDNLIKEPLFARFGGEEFILILPRLTANEAKQCIARLQEVVREMKFAGDAQLSITFSAGLSVFSGEQDPLELLKAADRALYQAKENGKDCFVLAAVSAI